MTAIRFVVALMAILSLIFVVERADAVFEVIAAPDFEYLDATTEIDLDSIPEDGTQLNAISDETLTLIFTPPTVYKEVRLRWSSPPDSETGAPLPVLWYEPYDGSSGTPTPLIIDLSIPVSTFGFELQPNLDFFQDVVVDFVQWNGSTIEPTIVGTIRLSVLGHHGARLFAASSPELRFNRIIINSGAEPISIGHIRYEVEPVEVEIDIKPSDSENVIILGKEHTIAVAILSNIGFNATLVDPRSVCFGGGTLGQYDCHARNKGFVDVDGDGDLDLLLHFNTRKAGISLGDSEACLTGRTFGAVPFGACDEVQPQAK